MKIYVVEAEEGAYSDRCNWVVCAYPSRELALEHCRLADLEAHKNQEAIRAWRVARKIGLAPMPEPLCVYDNGAGMGNTPDYTVVEIELREELP